MHFVPPSYATGSCYSTKIPGVAKVPSTINQSIHEWPHFGQTDLLLYTSISSFHTGDERRALAELAVGARGRCSLHAGAAGDQVQVLEVLLAAGAHATITDQDGYAPADTAIAHGAYIAGM